MEMMEHIRDQQDSLAKLHFELGVFRQMDGSGHSSSAATPLSEEGLRSGQDSMNMLMQRLEVLSGKH